jgi:predicted  nucleic acid-binding Zn-ribbon protein
LCLLLKAYKHEEHSEEQDAEMVKVLESLVADNEDLRRSHAEIQMLLQESRDDVHAIQLELEELRNAPPPNRKNLFFDGQVVC